MGHARPTFPLSPATPRAPSSLSRCRPGPACRRQLPRSRTRSLLSLFPLPDLSLLSAPSSPLPLSSPALNFPRDLRRASLLGPHAEASTPAFNWPRKPSPHLLPYPAATQTLARCSRAAPPRRASVPTRPRRPAPPLPCRSRTAASPRLLGHHRGARAPGASLHRPVHEHRTVLPAKHRRHAPAGRLCSIRA
jgi:hypothetical protein